MPDKSRFSCLVRIKNLFAIIQSNPLRLGMEPGSCAKDGYEPNENWLEAKLWWYSQSNTGNVVTATLCQGDVDDYLLPITTTYSNIGLMLRPPVDYEKYKMGVLCNQKPNQEGGCKFGYSSDDYGLGFNKYPLITLNQEIDPNKCECIFYVEGVGGNYDNARPYRVTIMRSSNPLPDDWWKRPFPGE